MSCIIINFQLLKTVYFSLNHHIVTHYTLNITHSTLHITHYTHIKHYTLNITHSTLHTQHYTLNITHYTLHSIHKTPLHFIKHHNPDSEQYHHKSEAIAEHRPAEGAYSQRSKLECFHNGSNGVNHHGQAYFIVGDGAEGVNNGCGIHPELHHEGEKDSHIAVLGSHGRNDNAKTKRQPCQHDYKHGEKQHVYVRSYRNSRHKIKHIYCKKQAELYSEPEQVGRNNRKRHDEARKIYFTENPLISEESIGGFVEAIGEILPAQDTRKVEKRLRQSVGTDTGNAAKNDHIHHHSEQRLYKKPRRSENGLLVLSDYVALHKHAEQIAVLPDFFQINFKELVLGFYDGGVFLFHSYYK